jgi:lipopolysaccharide transport system ATP-binding protein
MLGMNRSEIKKKYDEIVDFSGVERFLETPVKRYSSGMYVRLAFAVAAHMEPDVLIVDEVLAVGDAEFQKKCMGKMKSVSVKDGRTILFVSHQIGAVQNLCNKCLYLKNGKVVSDGPMQETIEQYAKDNRQVKNSKSFDKYLKYVKIEQKNAGITLEAEYDCEFGLDIPHLGFVIHNSEGLPVFASNPTLDQQLIRTKTKYRKGKIVLAINQPKLIDGEYMASIWFGNSKENFISDLECISFQVNGMTNKKQYSQTLTGNVVPELTWKFNEYE